MSQPYNHKTLETIYQNLSLLIGNQKGFIFENFSFAVHFTLDQRVVPFLDSHSIYLYPSLCMLPYSFLRTLGVCCVVYSTVYELGSCPFLQTLCLPGKYLLVQDLGALKCVKRPAIWLKTISFHEMFIIDSIYTKHGIKVKFIELKLSVQ